MLHLGHIGNEIGHIHEPLIGIAPGEHNLGFLRAPLENLQDVIDRKQVEVIGDGDFIENDDIVFSRGQHPSDFIEPLLRQSDIFRLGVLLDKALAAVLFDNDAVGEILKGGDFAVLHALDELADEDLHAGAHRPERQPHSGRGLAFTVAGVDVQVTLHRYS